MTIQKEYHCISILDPSTSSKSVNFLEVEFWTYIVLGCPMGPLHICGGKGFSKKDGRFQDSGP